jgi:hypothetical protein
VFNCSPLSGGELFKWFQADYLTSSKQENNVDTNVMLVNAEGQEMCVHREAVKRYAAKGWKLKGAVAAAEETPTLTVTKKKASRKR